jgi:hypothetical protein
MPTGKDKAENEREELIVRMDAALLERIEDFQFKHRFRSRTHAIRFLLDAGLKSGKKPDAKDLGDRRSK